MTEINYADDYKAEKHLRKLAGMSMQEQDKLRKERKHKQKERLAIIARMDELEKELCEDCRKSIKRSAEEMQCSCAAAKGLRHLGERLLKLSEGEPERILKKNNDVKESLTVEEYEALKNKGMNDKEIMKEIRWSTVRFYEWKKANGLTERAPTVPTRTSLKGKPLNSMTIEDYHAYKTDKLSDTKISEKIGVANHVLQQWKKDNELTKSHDAAQQPAKPKEDKSMSNEQKATPIDYKAKYEAMESKFNSAAKDYSDLKMESLEYRKELKELRQSVIDAGEVIGRKNTEIKRLTDKVAELEESLAQSNHVSEMTNLHFELERLKKYEFDYSKLKADHALLRAKYHGLEEELELYRHDDMMFRLLSKKYNAVRDRMDEVMA